MHLYGTFIAALVVAFSSMSAAIAQTWREYRPSGIGYSIEMPGDWKVSSQDTPTDLGLLRMHMAVVDQTTKAYMSIYTVFPQAHIDRNPVDRLLDNGRDGAVKSVQGRLMSEQRFKVGGYPARHIVIDARNQRLSLRFVIVGTTMVQAIFAGPPGAESDPNVKRFFDSLRVGVRP